MSLNKKKVIQRFYKQNKSKEYPVLNLMMLILIITQVISEITDTYFFKLFKPIPIIMMIFYISGKNSVRDHLLPTLIQSGLVLFLIGDIVVMINEISAFLIGTVFFLLGSILYLVGLNIGQRVRQIGIIEQIIKILGCAVFFSAFIAHVYFFWNLMPNKVLYTSYGGCVYFMNIFSILRYEKTTPYSFKFMGLGSFLFLLAFNLGGYMRFNGIPSHFGKGIVMLAYYSGQYLIMHGALHHSNLQNEISKFFKYKSYQNK